jgi:hypothetical protein
VVDSTGSIAVQAITVAVRDSSGDNLDFLEIEPCNGDPDQDWL